ncbi:hypothetical protein GCM10010377_08250 [Streptomyces viridiviolaceus]|nr:hypothetical protein GCM10010377_08250 [Streptomyces viridiviolaceus]
MSPVKAVLFDRDGTLVHDVPYNGDPARVRPVEGAREALALLRRSGIRTGVVTNQSGIARGLLTDADVRHVNRRIDELLGPFDVWAVCPHGPDDGCHCRKPQPGLVLWAAGRICTAPGDCVVIGDIGADVEAAERAGAHGILVPNRQTRPEETSAAGHVAPDLLTAVRAVLHGPPRGRVLADERPIEAAYTTDTGAFESAPAPARVRPATGKAGNTPGPRRGDSTDGAGAGPVASEAWGSGGADGGGHGSDVGLGGPFARGGGAGSESWGSGVVGGGPGSGFGPGGPVARGGGVGSEPWGSGGGRRFGCGRGVPVDGGGPTGSGTSDLRRPR